MMSKDKYTVFLVDDSANDRLFMRMALERSSKFVVMREARDGQEVMDYFDDAGAFRDRQTYPMPDLLLLDIKMPRVNGYDVLSWLKARAFKNLTVVVVSDSGLPEDIAQSLAWGADGHFRKTSIKKEQETMLLGIVELVEMHGCGP
jgi:CheY-like chemotaxis protein